MVSGAMPMRVTGAGSDGIAGRVHPSTSEFALDFVGRYGG